MELSCPGALCLIWQNLHLTSSLHTLHLNTNADVRHSLYCLDRVDTYYLLIC